MVLPPQLSLNIYRNQTISCIINTTRGIMPMVAINDEHMCLYDREKTTWLFFVFTNTATKITKCGHTDTKKQNLCFK